MADKHVHKFQRHRYKSGNIVYFCVLDCNVKIAVPMALGKRAICWRCGNEFTMGEYHIRLAKPHCDACHKPHGINQFTDFPSTPAPVLEKANDLMSRLRTVTKADEEEDI